MPQQLDVPQLTRLASLAESRGLKADNLISWLEHALEEIAVGSEDPARELSEAERQVLAEEGLEQGPETEEPLARSIGAYFQLVDQALTVAEAARRLGISPSRVRQLLGARRLYGVKMGRDWRLPRWQFRPRARDLVPGIERVNQAFSVDLHPLSVQGFLTTPQPELQLGDEPVSPLNWLASGGAPEPVAELAADL